MSDVKAVNTHLVDHFRLCQDHLCQDRCPQTKEEKRFMTKVSYVSNIRSLMYAMVHTRPNVGHVVGIVSKFISNPGKAH